MPAAIFSSAFCLPSFGRDRLGGLVAELAVGPELETHSGGKGFVVATRVRFAADDQAKNAVGAPEPLEREHFLVDPVRARRGRRADHELERGITQRLRQDVAEVRRGRQFLSVAEHGREPRRNDAGHRRLADERLWNAISL
jgi:hypothetical protein